MSEIVRADGTLVRNFRQFGSHAPLRPLASAGHQVVFIAGGQAYRVGQEATSRPQLVGAADRLFPSGRGNVGLAVGHGTTEQIRFVAADTTVPAPNTTVSQLPAGMMAVARLVDGILVLADDGHLRFVDSGFGLDLGPVGNVVDTVGEIVTWTSQGGCAADGVSCPLHMSETASGSDRLIAPPAGFGGFVGGGAVSPDGTVLAAFVFAPTDARPGVRLTVVDTRTGQAQVVGPDLAAGEPIGSAAWSTDGHWLFFSGLTGPMYALRMSPAGPVGSAIALPLPASYSFTAF